MSIYSFWQNYDTYLIVVRRDVIEAHKWCCSACKQKYTKHYVQSHACKIIMITYTSLHCLPCLKSLIRIQLVQLSTNLGLRSRLTK